MKLSTDSFSAYLQEIGRYPLLTKNQEILLARQVQEWLKSDDPKSRAAKRGQRAYQKLINCNLRLVVSVAKKYTHKIKRTELFDLVQEGNMGLAHGIKKFDPERGYALSTYVYWWIRQSITRYIGSNDRLIRLPSHAVELLNKIRAWTPMFEQLHNRKPTIEECADYCKVSPDRLIEYMDKSSDATSLDMMVKGTDGEVALIDGVASEVDVFEEVCALQSLEDVENLLVNLNDRQKFIVKGVHGFNTGEPETFQAIGKQLGISRERARNIYHNVLRILKIRYNFTYNRQNTKNGMP